MGRALSVERLRNSLEFTVIQPGVVPSLLVSLSDTSSGLLPIDDPQTRPSSGLLPMGDPPDRQKEGLSACCECPVIRGDREEMLRSLSG